MFLKEEFYYAHFDGLFYRLISNKHICEYNYKGTLKVNKNKAAFDFLRF